jgi:protocatechuate 3,4-dioxygenase beta subunit
MRAISTTASAVVRALLITIALLATAGAGTAYADNGSISGKMTAATGGAGVSGSIYLYNATTSNYVTSTSTTDASTGAYSFSSVAPGSYKVFFSPYQPSTGNGYVPIYYGGATLIAGGTSFTLASGAALTGIDGSLPDGGVISGKVTDEDGNPLSGANITAYSSGSGYYFTSYASTAADGTYHLRGLQTSTWRVTFSDTTHNKIQQYYPGAQNSSDAGSVSVTAGSESSSINATMVAAATVKGKVTAGGSGLGNVTVGLQASSGSTVYSAYTASDGTYTVIGLPAGSYTARYSPQSGSPYQPATRAGTVDVTKGATVSGIDQVLVEGGKIKGTVTDKSGAPVAGVSVSSFPVSGSGSSTYATTAADGTYTLSGLTQNTYRVTFSGGTPTIVTTYYGGDLSSQATPVTSGPGTVATGIDKTVVRGATISGSYKKPDGSAAAGVSIYASSTDGTNNFYAYASTGIDGTFKVSGLAPGSYRLSTSAAGYLTRYYPDSPTAAGAQVITLAEAENKTLPAATLVAGGKVTGKVTDSTGAGVTGVIGLFLPDAPYAYPTRTVYTATDGTYTIDGLETGKYVVGFQAGPIGSYPGWNSSSSTTSRFYVDGTVVDDGTPVSVTVGATTSSIDIKQPAPAKLSGKVTGPGGAALASASVSAYRALGDGAIADQSSYSTGVDSSGAFTFSGIADGRYVLRASGYDADYHQLPPRWSGNAAYPDRAQVYTVKASSSITGADVALIAGTSISGTVSGAGVGPLEDAFVSAAPLDDPTSSGASASTDGSGSYVLRGLADGRYRLTANGPSGWKRKTIGTVTVSGTALTGQDATLARGPLFTGTVVDADGNGVPYATIELIGDHGSDETSTDEDGAFQTAYLDAGSYRLLVSGDEIAPTWYDGASGSLTPGPAKVVDLTDGATTTVAIKVKPGAVIKGTIRRTGGVVSYASVTLYDNSGDVVDTTSSSYDGTYRFGGLREGKYRVKASQSYNYVDGFNGGAATLESAPAINASHATPAPDQDITLASLYPTTPTTPQPTSTTPQPTSTTPTSAIKGTLKDNTGAPITGGVTVYASGITNTGDYFQTSTIGSDGSYSLPVRAGSYRVSVSNSYFGSEQKYATRYYPDAKTYDAAQAVVVGTNATVTGISLTLPLAGSITGRIVDGAGDGVGSANVGLYNDAGSYLASTTTTPQGRYKFRAIEPSKVVLQVTPPAGSGLAGRYLDDADTLADATRFDLTGGVALTKNVTLGVGGKLTGTVRDGRGVGVDRAIVSIYAADNSYSPQRSVRAAADGTYTFSGLTAGDYRLRFSPPPSRSELGIRFSGGATTITGASSYHVSRGATVSNIDATLSSGATVSGTVKAAGQPLAGIVVSATPDSDDDYYGTQLTTTTDDAGHYEFHAIADGATRLYFSDDSGDHVSQFYGQTAGVGDWVTVDAKASTPRANIDVTLAKAAHISGSITNAAGDAIRITDDYSSSTPWATLYDAEGDYVAQDSADARSGRFTFDGLAPGTYTVAFSAYGYVGQTYSAKPVGADGTPIVLATGETKTGIDAKLVRGGTISGKITSSDGSALGYGVRVLALDAAGVTLAQSYVSQDYADPTTGTYSITGVPAGTVRVLFDGSTASEFGEHVFYKQYYDKSATLAGAKALTIEVGKTVSGIDATLVPQPPADPGAIAGTVSGPSGAIAGASITIYDASRSSVDTIETDADGKFRESGLSPGDHYVRYAATGLTTEYFDDVATLTAAKAIAVTSGGTATASATLAEAPGGLSGTVRQAGGTAISGASVSVFPASAANTSTPTATVTTTSAGAWSVSSLAAGSYKIRVTAAGYTEQFYNGKTTLAAADALAVAKGAVKTVDDLVLVPVPGAISGTVKAAGGSGLSGATISAYDSATGSVVKTATSGADGTYTISGVAPGTYKVGFVAAGRSPAFYDAAATLAAAQTVTVTAGATKTGIDASLATPPPTTGSIGGKVTGAGAAALSGATVTLYDGTTLVQSAITGAPGTFLFEGLPVGTAYALKFEATGYTTEYYADAATLATATKLSVTAGGATTANATLAPAPAVLKGQVSDAGGNLAGVTVNVYGATGSALDGAPVTTGADGTFQVSRPAGTYRLGFTKAGYADRFYNGKTTLADATAIVAAAGSTTTGLDARLQSLSEPGTLSGRITSGGSGLGGATVTVKVSGTGAVSRTVTSAGDGTWQASSLAPGTYTISAAATGYAPGAVADPITLGPGQSVSAPAIDLAANPGTLTGAVSSAGGPLSGVAVTVYGAGGAPVAGATATTGANGSYSITVGPGTYRLGFAKEGYTATFRGGATLAAATSIVVGPGQSVNALDVTLVAVVVTPPDGGNGNGNGGGGGGGGAPADNGTPAPPATQAPAQTPTAEKTIAPALKLAGKKLEVSKNGSITIPANCPAGKTCSATATVTFQPKKGKKDKKAPKPVTIGSASSTATGFTITLNAAGKKLLKASPKGLKVTIVVTATGSTTPASAVSVTLTPAKVKGKKSVLELAGA